ncbi:hypothetical protein [Kocuria sp.]|uniref:hypothetical protein n=1 Tax=Kocuria sp. TaxID=1871328 RepID=UPI0026DB6EDD|nr:hypothetical protein [Kocuria sp.]MDO4919905.1 hypothetical protein [Kocuria sp.]
MSDDDKVVPLEEYGRQVKAHQGNYELTGHFMALLRANNQEGDDDAGEPTDA